MTNSDRLQEIRERADKATPGPWNCWDGWGPISGGYLEGLMAMARIGPSGGRSQEVLSASDETQRDIYAKREDAEFIAASREDIPWLLQHITEQQREIDRLKGFVMATAQLAACVAEIERNGCETDRILASLAQKEFIKATPKEPEAKGYRKQERPM